MTLSTQRVLRALLDVGKPMYGREIVAASGVGEGSIYPILAKLRAAGWLEGHWEDTDPASDQRPRRRYHKIVSEREAEIRATLDATGFAKLSVVKGPV